MNSHIQLYHFYQVMIKVTNYISKEQKQKDSHKSCLISLKFKEKPNYTKTYFVLVQENEQILVKKNYLFDVEFFR